MYSKEKQLNESRPEKSQCRLTHCMTLTMNENRICDKCAAALSGKKKRRKSKPKKKDARYWRKKAKESFQKFVRIRDANKDGICSCVTCGRQVVYNRNCDGGHYRSAKFNATCFDERNCHAQCKSCNMSRMDMIETLQEYERQIDLKYGKGSAEQLRITSLTTKRYSSAEYEGLYKYFKEKGRELAKQKGLSY